MKKVAIDVRMMGLKHAGIGRYVENLAKKVEKNREFKIVLLKEGGRHYSLSEQLVMPWLIWSSQVDLIHFPHFNVPLFCPKPFVVTIHDLIKHRFRGLETTTRSAFFYGLKYLGYLAIFALAVKRAKRIIVPSLAVKKELLARYRLNPQKIIVIYEGVSPDFKPETKRESGRPLLVYTGNLYPHKNVVRLVKAIKELNNIYHLSVSLAIVCGRNVFWQRTLRKIRALEAGKFVKLLGFVPDEDLVKLYHQANALVQPSLMEGFDLTVVEAMAAGLPVIVSDIPVHREVCGQAVVYFNPYDYKEIAEKIKLVLSSAKLRQEMRKKGLKQAKKFSWKKTAEQTLKVYYHCLAAYNQAIPDVST